MSPALVLSSRPARTLHPLAAVTIAITIPPSSSTSLGVPLESSMEAGALTTS
jgi:hypothetical protein